MSLNETRKYYWEEYENYIFENAIEVIQVDNSVKDKPVEKVAVIEKVEDPKKVEKKLEKKAEKKVEKPIVIKANVHKFTFSVPHYIFLKILCGELKSFYFSDKTIEIGDIIRIESEKENLYNDRFFEKHPYVNVIVKKKDRKNYVDDFFTFELI